MARYRRIVLVGLSVVLFVLAYGFWVWSTRQNNDPEASFQRGLAAIKARDTIALHREIEILKRFPLYVHQMQLLRGTVLLTGQDFAGALTEFSECSRDPQTQGLALTLVGETLCRLGRPAEAIKTLDRAAELDSPSIETYRWLAVACYDMGARTRAAAAVRKVIDLDPKDFRPYRLLGLIQKDRGRFSEAVPEYRACLRLKPKDEAIRREVLYELSDCLTQLSKFDEALKFLDEVPESADVQALRAHCYFGLGNRTAAREAAERALELDPNHIEGRGWLANLDLEAGNFQAAADNLERVVAKYPAEFAPRFKLSEAYQSLKLKPQAEEQLKKAKELQALSQKFAELSDKASQNPKDASLRFELGETARLLQRPKLARLWYQATLAVDPKFDKAKQALKDLPTPKAG